MVSDIIPAHVNGRKFEELQDPRLTLDQTGVTVGGYLRVSTKKDSQKSSPKNQKKLLAEWAELNNCLMVDYYEDIMSGGYAANRDDLQRMLEDIKIGRIKGVVTKELSRTSRDIKDILEIKRLIASYGGFIIAIKEGYDSRTDEDEFLLAIHGALAQKERNGTAGRVKLTQMIKAKEGKTNVPQPAYGYMLSEDGQYIVRNPETEPVYRLIVDKFANEGWGHLKIAKYLNSQGIPSKRGELWCTNAIKTILTNPVYLGITIYNATTLVRDPSGKQKRVVRPKEDWVIRENTHEPLLTPEEWERIQQITNERKMKDTKEWTCDRKYLGSGILRCDECGEKIYGARHPKKSKGQKVLGQYLYRYCCMGRTGDCSPPLKRWRMEEVDANILDLFASIFSDKERFLEAISQQIHLDDQTDSDETMREELRRKKEKIDSAIRKQQLAYEEDVINLEEFRQRMEELRKEKDYVTRTLNQLNNKLSKTDLVKNRIEKLYQQMESKLKTLHDLPSEETINLISSTFSAIYLSREYTITDVDFNI